MLRSRKSCDCGFCDGFLRQIHGRCTRHGSESRQDNRLLLADLGVGYIPRLFHAAFGGRGVSGRTPSHNAANRVGDFTEDKAS